MRLYENYSGFCYIGNNITLAKCNNAGLPRRSLVQRFYNDSNRANLTNGLNTVSKAASKLNAASGGYISALWSVTGFPTHTYDSRAYFRTHPNSPTSFQSKQRVNGPHSPPEAHKAPQGQHILPGLEPSRRPPRHRLQWQDRQADEVQQPCLQSRGTGGEWHNIGGCKGYVSGKWLNQTIILTNYSSRTLRNLWSILQQAVYVPIKASHRGNDFLLWLDYFY